MCSLQLDVNSVAALQAEVSAMCRPQQARSQKRKALLAHQGKTCFPLWGGGTDAEYCWLWFCWSPAAEMKWETLCSRSKQLLSFTLHSHKELSGLCLWIGITFMLAALKYSVSYLLMRVGGKKRLFDWFTSFILTAQESTLLSGDALCLILLYWRNKGPGNLPDLYR